ncbi:MAG: hypothetical protein EOM70_10440 [Clostridia bacterium]|nr:hypothetical protein [Clostridia bacterium]
MRCCALGLVLFLSLWPAGSVSGAESVRQITPTRIRLNWSAVDGAARYEIYRSTDSDGKFQKIYTAFSTRFLNITCKPGVAYYHKIRAYAYTNGAKVYGPFSDVRRQDHLVTQH